jgi:hypothetical protein
MLLSSILALAFPREVPHLSRAAGAIPIVVVVAALPLAVLAGRWRAGLGEAGATLFGAVLVGLFAWMGSNTWQRYFTEYRAGYDQASQSHTAGAREGHAFLAQGGDLSHVYLVGWEHGWDWRALGLLLGDPSWHNNLFEGGVSAEDAVEQAQQHIGDPAMKLYFVGGSYATDNIAYLQQLYPEAEVRQHSAPLPHQVFWTVHVPARSVP